MRRKPSDQVPSCGFLDDDPTSKGGWSRVFPCWRADGLADILQRQKVQGLIISSPSILANGRAE